MNLMDYGRILARRGWIILLLAWVAGGSAYLLTRGQAPEYRASQLVVLQPSRADLGLAEASVRLLNSVVVIIDSVEVAQAIIEENRLDMKPAELKSNVTIAPDQLRLTIQIDVDHQDASVAEKVARAWGQKLSDYRERENQQSRQEDRVKAVMPEGPRIAQTAPRPRLNAIAGGILGFILGGMIVFILEFIESGIVRHPEDLERVMDIPVLASIPHFD